MIGVILGTICLNLRLNEDGKILSEMVDMYHEQIQKGIEMGLDTLIRISIYRMCMLVILIYGLYWTQSFTVLYVFVCICGMSLGYTVSLLSYCYGLKGILCTVCYLLPHGCIYIPLVLEVLKETASQIYDRYYTNFRRVWLFIAVLFIGCGMECYIHPIIIKFFIKKFL